MRASAVYLLVWALCPASSACGWLDTVVSANAETHVWKTNHIYRCKDTEYCKRSSNGKVTVDAEDF